MNENSPRPTRKFGAGRASKENVRSVHCLHSQMESHDGISVSLEKARDEFRGITRNETKGRFTKVKIPGNATLYGKDSEWKR